MVFFFGGGGGGEQQKEQQLSNVSPFCVDLASLRPNQFAAIFHCWLLTFSHPAHSEKLIMISRVSSLPVRKLNSPFDKACAHFDMVSKFQWKLFCLPPSWIHRMTGLGGKIV